MASMLCAPLLKTPVKNTVSNMRLSYVRIHIRKLSLFISYWYYLLSAMRWYVCSCLTLADNSIERRMIVEFHSEWWLRNVWLVRLSFGVAWLAHRRHINAIILLIYYVKGITTGSPRDHRRRIRYINHKTVTGGHDAENHCDIVRHSEATRYDNIEQKVNGIVEFALF